MEMLTVNKRVKAVNVLLKMETENNEAETNDKKLNQYISILIIGLCILLRVYQLNIGITSVRNKVFFGARFYCALLTLHVSAPFGGHLQVVRKHKKYLTSLQLS
jgi:hypothetical protein